MAWIWNRRLLWVVLIGALALNLFLGSVLAGRWMARSERTWSLASMIERRAERLPEADAAVLRTAFDEQKAGLETLVDQLRAARERARAAANAEPFEAAALQAALAQVRSRTGAVQEAFHDLYLEVAPALSSAGRRGLFERRRGEQE